MTDVSSPRTDRQLREAEVYDQRAEAAMGTLDDADLLVDPLTPPFPNREHVEPLGFALSQLQPLGGRRVLEVGCGSGNLTTWAALQGARATGVDVSDGMLALARRRAAVNGVSDLVTLVSSPLEAMDPRDGRFDLILANQVLHHLELDGAMENIRRLLLPGGRAVFVEPVLLVPEVARRIRNSRAVTRRFPLRTDTPDERSLGIRDLERVERGFGSSQRHAFQLLCRIQNFVELSDPTFARLQALDRRLLQLPSLWRLCRYVVLVFENEPRPDPRRDS
jgi:SAM-dependent methyltransferase